MLVFWITAGKRGEFKLEPVNCESYPLRWHGATSRNEVEKEKPFPGGVCKSGFEGFPLRPLSRAVGK